MVRAMSAGALLLFSVGLAATGKPNPTTLAGQWAGTARTPSETTRLLLTLESDGGRLYAAMTLLDIGVMSWPATRVSTKGGLQLSFPSDSGDQVMRLTLEPTATGEPRLTGTWSDQRFAQPATVTLQRATGAPPITASTVLIDGPAGQLGGEIILPAGPGPHPGVVFLHGAGPQPRDASRFAAYQMAELGVAALIFDKRGVGQSQGESAGASFEDLAEDGVAMARHLESLPQVSDVGFFGHSQGGWIAPLAAMRWPGAAFVITSAGPAVPPSREAHWEFVRNLRTLAAGDAAIEAAREVIDYWHDGVRSGDWRNYDAAVKTLSTKAWFEPAGLHRLPRPPDPAFAAMYLAYMDYDPMPALRALKTPMLALLAPRDESIDALETAGILRALAASGADIHIRMYPGFDHAMRSLGLDGQPLRWPRHPADYFSTQAEFINRAISGR